MIILLGKKNCFSPTKHLSSIKHNFAPQQMNSTLDADCGDANNHANRGVIMTGEQRNDRPLSSALQHTTSVTLAARSFEFRLPSDFAGLMRKRRVLTHRNERVGATWRIPRTAESGYDEHKRVKQASCLLSASPFPLSLCLSLFHTHKHTHALTRNM